MLSKGLLPLLALVTASLASAGPILDQHLDFGHCPGCTANVAFAIDSAFSDLGQTVTAGVTGNLDSVGIYAYQNFSEPFVIDIIAAPGGAPNGDVLAVSNTFTLPSSYALVNVPIPGMPFFHAGDQFAIDLRIQGINGSPLLFAGGWEGGISPGSPYSGGVVVTGESTSMLAPYGVTNNFQGDLYFQTYVTPAVPEPAFLIPLTAMLCGLACRRFLPPRWPSPPRTIR